MCVYIYTHFERERERCNHKLSNRESGWPVLKVSASSLVDDTLSSSKGKGGSTLLKVFLNSLALPSKESVRATKNTTRRAHLEPILILI